MFVTNPVPTLSVPFYIDFKGNTLEILCLLQKARAGEAPVTYDVTPCDKMSQKAKEIEQFVLRFPPPKGLYYLVPNLVKMVKKL